MYCAGLLSNCSRLVPVSLSECGCIVLSLQVRLRFCELDHRVRWQTTEAKAAEKEARRLRAERVAQMEAEAEAAAAASAAVSAAVGGV